MDRVDNQDAFQVPPDDTGWYVAPDDHVEEDAYSEEGAPTEEVVERQLAHYGFVREERDREVRLIFRDTPPAEIARAFRAGGAYLITLMGERAPTSNPTGPQPPMTPNRRTPHSTLHTPHSAEGEATVRYFYNLGETVYTVSIVFTAGVAESVAGVYPSAARLEREVSERSAIVFTPGMQL